MFIFGCKVYLTGSDLIEVNLGVDLLHAGDGNARMSSMNLMIQPDLMRPKKFSAVGRVMMNGYCGFPAFQEIRYLTQALGIGSVNFAG